jgi:hypothetical protein
MGVRWSQSDVQKASGSALDMILNASFFFLLKEFFLIPRLALPHALHLKMVT